MRAVGGITPGWLLAAAWPGLAAAQLSQAAAERAESLWLAGRPWHAAEALLAAAAHEPRQSAIFIFEGAKAELRARRYDRARSLLVGQPWLESYPEGAALAALAEAEARLGLHAPAASHFAAARARASGARAALLGVRAGLAYEAAGQPDSAAGAYAGARAAGLEAIHTWLRLREAQVTRDTAAAAWLLAGLPPPVGRGASAARARALLLAGDSAAALAVFAQAEQWLDFVRVALARGDSMRARGALYDLLARSPESDEGGAAVGAALAALPPRSAPERVALARALKSHGAAADARVQVARALQSGDSSAATLLLFGELLTAGGRHRAAERVYLLVARDSALGPLATYRRARVLARLGDAGADEALAGFAETYPADTAAPAALYFLGELHGDRSDAAGAARWFGELVRRYPGDPRASLVRFRLAAQAYRAGELDSAVALFGAEAAAAAPPQRLAARFWLGKLERQRGDTAAANDAWRALARDDSLGYYGLRARREVGLPPLRIAAPPLPWPPPPATVTATLGRIDTLVLAGLDSEARAEVQGILAAGRGSPDRDALLGWSEGLAARGWGPAAVRLAWQAATLAPNDPRVLRAIFPWPNRAAVEGEASEFGVDALLFAALVRQESVFDAEALSPAGARGLAQLLPETAALTARSLDVTFYPEWITVPDLNLHLGAAHFAQLLQRFGQRVEAAVAAYNAGVTPVKRWLGHPGADDPDQFIELIPYPETRGYVRAVLRNRELYRALYESSTN